MVRSAAGGKRIGQAVAVDIGGCNNAGDGRIFVAGCGAVCTDRRVVGGIDGDVYGDRIGAAVSIRDHNIETVGAVEVGIGRVGVLAAVESDRTMGRGGAGGERITQVVAVDIGSGDGADDGRVFIT